MRASDRSEQREVYGVELRLVVQSPEGHKVFLQNAEWTEFQQKDFAEPPHILPDLVRIFYTIKRVGSYEKKDFILNTRERKILNLESLGLTRGEQNTLQEKISVMCDYISEHRDTIYTRIYARPTR